MPPWPLSLSSSPLSGSPRHYLGTWCQKNMHKTPGNNWVATDLQSPEDFPFPSSPITHLLPIVGITDCWLEFGLFVFFPKLWWYNACLTDFLPPLFFAMLEMLIISMMSKDKTYHLRHHPTYEMVVLGKAPIKNSHLKNKILERNVIIHSLTVLLRTSCVTCTVLCTWCSVDEPKRHAPWPQWAYVFVEGNRQKLYLNK